MMHNIQKLQNTSSYMSYLQHKHGIAIIQARYCQC